MSRLLKPVCPRARALQQEKPPQWEASALQLQSSTCSPQLEKSPEQPKKNKTKKPTAVGCHFLLQGIFPTQESNLRLLHWKANSLPLSRLERPLYHTIGYWSYPRLPDRCLLRISCGWVSRELHVDKIQLLLWTQGKDCINYNVPHDEIICGHY